MYIRRRSHARTHAPNAQKIGSYGNPHSRTHSYGWESESAVESARAQIANLIGASPKEVVFTSGATESNNLSIKGAAHFYGSASTGARRHLITTQTEHKCVLDSCRSLEREGYDVTYLPVSAGTGMVDVHELESAMRDDTLLVSVMAVNNEIGTRQPIEEIGRMCRGRRVLFHTDGAWTMRERPFFLILFFGVGGRDQAEVATNFSPDDRFHFRSRCGRGSSAVYLRGHDGGMMGPWSRLGGVEVGGGGWGGVVRGEDRPRRRRRCCCRRSYSLLFHYSSAHGGWFHFSRGGDDVVVYPTHVP